MCACVYVCVRVFSTNIKIMLKLFSFLFPLTLNMNNKKVIVNSLRKYEQKRNQGRKRKKYICVGYIYVHTYVYNNKTMV